MLSAADHQKVSEAVQSAESRTSGEIVCILAAEVSNYRETPLAIASALALLGPLAALLAGWRPVSLAAWAAGWSVGHAGATSVLVLALEGFVIGQCLVFAVVAALTSIPPVRRALTPPSLKRHRVHRAALQQFLATGLHANPARTGVVIFASMMDRRVELLADDAIHAAVGETAWNAAVQAVQDGMRRNDPAGGLVRAVEMCGEALAAHFPTAGDASHRHGDPMVEL